MPPATGIDSNRKLRVNSFLNAIRKTPLMFDGAMGTRLYEKGVFINTCYDELNLTNPKLVAEIHQEYRDAGADVIETNTFGANAIKLAEHGLANRVRDINRIGVELARKAAGADAYVAGSVGPTLRLGRMWQSGKTEPIREAFSEQIAALAEAGADLLMLETFDSLAELQLAAGIAAEAGLPVIASFSVNAQGDTIRQRSVEAMVSVLSDNSDVDVIGLNCGVGPAAAYDAAVRAVPLTAKPFIVMPNAGMPREVEGRMIYLTSPEYFTSYAKRFVELGIRGIGGCCGTGPSHIREAGKAIRSLSGVKRHITVQSMPETDIIVDVVPPEKRSRFAARLAAGRKVTSIELLPPRSCDLGPLLAKTRECHEAGIDAINIPDGPRASARVSPMIAAMAILNEVGIEPILHYCCRDRNLIGMQSDLMGAQVAGLRNILIITGDPPKLGDYPDATGVFDVDSIGLTRVAANLNHGIDLGTNPVDPPTSIFIGIGANPCALSMDTEVERYVAKVEAGAHFAITQPIFDPEALLRFLDRVEAHEKTIPVVAGVWPLVSYKNAEFMRNEIPGVEVPDHVMERMSRCRTKEEGIQTGVELSRDICAEIADRVAGFQVSAPFGRVQIALSVLEG
ncbi:MAG: bifunctional homocysteine S-methyltransferase/methylenetetrahydrofolate reductase [Lentisphaerae bacterium]|jgi:methionine synthase / methylenetetrahydrofolate reductase(NADPH)|nr:bifunctional homocysteine S-methyltransferase/methylenetetrahydrofolate reductase [Lentisphaerota bacterium]MBT4823437.1 bifunctional homocysteine S-methyltransferase/methylenetetrahydrofolate reductase [Lentisphaerota bacterium]MBT5607992.1 bifunctional homocysteine S-methyltransferase/methylenetetrahydrofolate reductase [Lentisphaerota bacterium]MBT7057519.1 bifunctional homocysteine S-methyltransferase/methylenetetrahydrofolate reductase [Lentisphaerota bacterium]MBT7845665.1 bifunctional